MKSSSNKYTLIKLSFLVACCFYAAPVSATTWYNTGNFDFTSIEIVSYNSKFINSSGVATFTIIGTAFGASTGIGGIFANQDQFVIQRCLALAEQFNLSRRINSNLLLRIQVSTDPSSSGNSLIDYCTLYQ